MAQVYAQIEKNERGDTFRLPPGWLTTVLTTEPDETLNDH